MIYICSECGRKLDVTIDEADGEVIVDPCQGCLDVEFENGRAEGWEEGYESGSAEAINGRFED